MAKRKKKKEVFGLIQLFIGLFAVLFIGFLIFISILFYENPFKTIIVMLYLILIFLFAFNFVEYSINLTENLI